MPLWGSYLPRNLSPGAYFLSHGHILSSIHPLILGCKAALAVLLCPGSLEVAPGRHSTRFAAFRIVYQEIHRALAVYRQLTGHFSYCSWEHLLKAWTCLSLHSQNAAPTRQVLPKDTHRALTAMLWQRQGMQFYLHFADEKFKSLIEMKVLSQAVSL